MYEITSKQLNQSEIRRLTAMQWLALACLGYSALAFALFPSSFLSVLGTYRLLQSFVVLPVVVLLGFLVAGIYHRPKSPIGFARDKLQSRGQGAAAIIGVFLLTVTGFTTFKHEFSSLVGFFADPMLAYIDNLLHFGDPWLYTRKVFPIALEMPLLVVYSILWFAFILSTVAYAAFVERDFDRIRYFFALALTAIILSSVVRLLLSSAGPIFYERMLGSDRFADLMSTLRSSEAGRKTIVVTDYLYTSYATQRTVLGTGIAAMPSLHVALTLLNALFISSRSRIGGYFAWIYFGIVLFGSVYFGWHYAVDGYVSIVLVSIFWWLAGKIAIRGTS